MQNNGYLAPSSDFHCAETSESGLSVYGGASCWISAVFPVYAVYGLLLAGGAARRRRGSQWTGSGCLHASCRLASAAAASVCS
jgi:hypothetical protein